MDQQRSCKLIKQSQTRVEVSMQFPCRIFHSLKKNANGYPCVHAMSMHHGCQSEYYKMNGFFWHGYYHRFCMEIQPGKIQAESGSM